MTLLLDTHALIWFLEGDPRLSAVARDAIGDVGNRVFVSVASAWEMAIKISLGKLVLPIPFDELYPGALNRLGFELLEIAPRHLQILATLPFHHLDPFDRLLIAQALAGDYELVTGEKTFASYGVIVRW